MWYVNSNSDDIKPSALDTTSSQKWNYIRKAFEEVPASEDIPAHWQWKEIKIRKEDWMIYEQVMNHETALDDVFAALVELAEIIEGE